MKKQHIIDLINLELKYWQTEDQEERKEIGKKQSDFKDLLEDLENEDFYKEATMIEEITRATAGVDLSADDYLKIFEICKIEVEE